MFRAGFLKRDPWLPQEDHEQKPSPKTFFKSLPVFWDKNEKIGGSFRAMTFLVFISIVG